MREFFLNVTNGETWKDDWCSQDNNFEQAATRDQLDNSTCKE